MAELLPLSQNKAQRLVKGFEKLAKLCRRNGGRNGALRAGAPPLQEEGKGLCRLGMEQMRSLSLQPGAIVAIDGPRRTVGVAVLREGSEEGERGIVQIDPILRGNAGIGLGEKVSLSKIVAGVARRLTLTPIPSAWVPRGQQERRELLR